MEHLQNRANSENGFECFVRIARDKNCTHLKVSWIFGSYKKIIFLKRNLTKLTCVKQKVDNFLGLFLISYWKNRYQQNRQHCPFN